MKRNNILFWCGFIPAVFLLFSLIALTCINNDTQSVLERDEAGADVGAPVDASGDADGADVALEGSEPGLSGDVGESPYPCTE